MSWIDRLKAAVEGCWQNHGLTHTIGWFQTSDLFNSTILVAYPVYQQVVGGRDDGRKVWTGFRFSLSELLKIENLKLLKLEGASRCDHCNPHPLFEVAGEFEGNEFNLIILLEPKLNTEVVEILDTISQSVRPIVRETQS